MSDNHALIKEGPNEIIRRIQVKNEKLHLMEMFAHNLKELCHHVMRCDLLALDNDTLGRVVELLCNDALYYAGYGEQLKAAGKKFGPGWVDAAIMRKALEAHTEDTHYAYLASS